MNMQPRVCSNHLADATVRRHRWALLAALLAMAFGATVTLEDQSPGPRSDSHGERAANGRL
jgi:hypothetical protein